MSDPVVMQPPPLAAWFYLSFADESGFLGGIYVRGRSNIDAIRESARLGENPGGSVVMAGPFEHAWIKERVPAKDRERLLTLEELEAHGPMGRI